MHKVSAQSAQSPAQHISPYVVVGDMCACVHVCSVHWSTAQMRFAEGHRYIILQRPTSARMIFCGDQTRADIDDIYPAPVQPMTKIVREGTAEEADELRRLIGAVLADATAQER